HGGLSRDETDDFAEEYAEHYCFMTQDKMIKYIEDGKVMVDPNDIISPFKEYAAYYADTIYPSNHYCELIGLRGEVNLCVLPLIGIDVVCNKDYDEEHPAGSKLNDILFYDQYLDTYGYLQSKEYQGESLKIGYGHIKDFEMRRINLLAENPVYLMESDFCLRLDHSPAVPDTYEFTIKFTFGSDPLTGETVDIAPVTVSMECK
ncbi:MAG: hypothetical protein II075_11285, partial [Bacteroidales bacterium]|nr:hypothetical protein [Bacteroidales bacterium]